MRTIGIAPCAAAGRLLVNGFPLCNRPVRVIHSRELLRFVSEGQALFFSLPRDYLIEEYRKTVRSLYDAYHGENGLKIRPRRNGQPSQRAAICAPWARTSAVCLSESIVLGCAHAQSKKGAGAHLPANADQPRTQSGGCQFTARPSPVLQDDDSK